VKRFLRDYGMIVMLVALCALFSILTIKKQIPMTKDAAGALASEIEAAHAKGDLILVAGSRVPASVDYAETLSKRLEAAGFTAVELVTGEARKLNLKLREIQSAGRRPAVIAPSGDLQSWGLVEQLPQKFPEFAEVPVLFPAPHWGSRFLEPGNLLAVIDRIVVIAIIAIGMTMVIITGGIDLSVGSLIALSAVISTLTMKKLGGLDAAPWVVGVGFTVGILGCGMLGAACGSIIARFKVAPFITTLALMMIARGLALQITQSRSIYQVPQALPWLGHGQSFGVPNTVILLVVLYVLGHVFMARTKLGRYIYAVGGNQEAARLSGVPVRRVLVFVYFVSALAAGLGGCIEASKVNTGTPNCGVMEELYVIAAVVVGGTSLSGGTGRIFNTLIGAFIISVIQNGMNQIGLEDYTQRIVLGVIILAAVLLDKFRSSGLLSILRVKSA